MTAHEEQRLAALHEYRLLNAPAGDELEAVVRVAAMVAGVPTGTLNLIDENRQCQLTSTGFEGGVSDRSDSMCAVRFETGEFTYLLEYRHPVKPCHVTLGARDGDMWLITVADNGIGIPDAQRDRGGTTVRFSLPAVAP